MRQGLVHVYTGDGKGKTTAALGLLLRASGRGMRAVLVQFFKGRDTGEVHALKNLNGVTVLRHTRDLGFYAFADETGKAEMARQNNDILLEASRLVYEGRCDLLVLDEICAAYANGALDIALADKLILHKPFGLELVLTGRNAPGHFVDAADYVTEFIKRKHPYDGGIAAREGIEY
ncbi:MAG: cob(I)yrinic acid a,c-diamide adenosyltransferase [Clostridia bacterium]|nr:cob(I)yrinic acid a,c-diamide adenosyltransferase [Clostridia bacterium]